MQISWILGQSALSFTIGSNNDQLDFKALPLGPCKAMNIYAHYDDVRSFAQIEISVQD
jgi:hypothetical protein